MGSKSNEFTFKRQKRTQRDRKKRPCEDRAKNWSNGSTNQEMPNIANSCQKPGARHGTDSPVVTPKGINLANTVILEL